jgi:hypothetical protein
MLTEDEAVKAKKNIELIMEGNFNLDRPDKDVIADLYLTLRMTLIALETVGTKVFPEAP